MTSLVNGRAWTETLAQREPLAPPRPLHSMHVLTKHDIDYPALLNRIGTSHTLTAGHHGEPKVSGESNNCWIRGVWLTSLTQCQNPEELRVTLTQALHGKMGDRFETYAKSQGRAQSAAMIDEVVGLVERFQGDGLEGIWRYGKIVPASSEKSVVKLTQLLLLKNLDRTVKHYQANPDPKHWLALKPSPDEWVTKKMGEIAAVTVGDAQGFSDYMACIFEVLGAEAFILNVNEETLEVHANVGTALYEVITNDRVSNGQLTESLYRNAFENRRIILDHEGTFNGGHVDARLPNTFLTRGR